MEETNRLVKSLKVIIDEKNIRDGGIIGKNQVLSERACRCAVAYGYDGHADNSGKFRDAAGGKITFGIVLDAHETVDVKKWIVKAKIRLCDYILSESNLSKDIRKAEYELMDLQATNSIQHGAAQALQYAVNGYKKNRWNEVSKSVSIVEA